jgi:hypothetical protein
VNLKYVLLSIGVFIAVLSIGTARGELFVVDDFEDGDYTNNPTWNVVSGGAFIGTGSGVSQELYFAWEQSDVLTLDIPGAIDGPMSLTYTLRLNDDYPSWLGEFYTHLVDTDTGKEHIEYAAVNLGYGVQGGGTSGFHSYDGFGNFAASLPAASGLSLYDAFVGYSPNVGTRKMMRFDFDPFAGVKFYFDGVLMCQWANFNGQTKVNQIKFTSHPASGFYWCVDDVVVGTGSASFGGPQYCGDDDTVYPEGDITGSNNVADCYVDELDLSLIAQEWLSCTDPESVDCDDNSNLTTVRDYRAIQTIYRNGVPHTDKNGIRRTTYSASESFFPIGILNAPRPGEYSGHTYDWNELVSANFNTVWPWPLMSAEDSLQAGVNYNMQIVIMNPVDSPTLNSIKDHPNLLGNLWRDEPPVDYPDAQTYMDDFITYRDMAHGIAPQMPVFVNLVAYIGSAWTTWNQIGDIACHDNYPLMPVSPTIGETSTDIPRVALLSAEVTDEQKPVWFIPANFQWANSPDHNFPFRMPTVEQVRTQVYAAIIHGVTGIHYFLWDTWIGRIGAVIGMSPDPQPTLLDPPVTPATPMQMNRSLAMWLATKQLNSELTTLTPAILSPTASAAVGYSVAITGQDVTNSPIRCILKEDPAGGYVLLTVNVDEAVLKATYTFDNELSSVDPLFENRSALSLPAGSHSFTQSYDPFEAHILHIDLVE